MNDWKQFILMKWEKLLLVAAAILLTLAAAAWILQWGGEQGRYISGAASPEPKSYLDPERAFEFREDNAAPKLRDPHPFFVVLPEKPRNNRPWIVFRPNKPDKPDQPDQPDKPDKPDKPDQPDKPDKPDQPDKPVPPKPTPHVRITYLGWMQTPSGEERALIHFPDSDTEVFVGPDEKIRDTLSIVTLSPDEFIVELPDGSTVAFKQKETKNLLLE